MFAFRRYDGCHAGEAGHRCRLTSGRTQLLLDRHELPETLVRAVSDRDRPAYRSGER
jgi:hypothetical protein